MKSATLVPLVIAAALAPAGLAHADQCAWNTKDIAQRAATIVKPEAVVLEYCEPCKDKAVGTAHEVKKVSVREPKAGYFELVVNDAPVDLAYLFIRTESDVFSNVGMLAGCSPQDVSKEIRGGKPSGYPARKREWHEPKATTP